VLRKALFLSALLGLFLVCSGIAVARNTPSLSTEGPTSVAGTEASVVFEIADRTIRQVRYDDDGTLRYTFRISNDGRLPVRVLGLAETQPETRLFTPTSLTDGSVSAGEAKDFTLALHMAGCETLSSRAGSFVTTVRVLTETAGVFDDTLDLELPEEVHTGSPREAFCPNSTATSRPPG
jgi:hypothetical protein